MGHILVIANETAASPALLDELVETASAGSRVTVVAPVSEPRHGYVVYQDTRRAAAGRRLEKTLGLLRSSGIPAQGFVVDTSPLQAVKDALAQLEPAPDQIIISTHGPQRSSWLRRDVVTEIERAAAPIPVRNVRATGDSGVSDKNILVVANETVLSGALLDRVRARAKEGPASFLIISPQSDDEPHPQAERRLRRALSDLRSEGIDVHGQVVHPDPFTASIEATHDERIDEIIVSTFPSERSGWMRRDLVARVRQETGLPVDHVVAE